MAEEDKESKYKRFFEFLEKNKELIAREFDEINNMGNCGKSLEELTYDTRVPGGIPGPTPLSHLPVGPGNIDFLYHKVPDIKEVEKKFIEYLKKKADEKKK